MSVQLCFPVWDPEQNCWVMKEVGELPPGETDPTGPVCGLPVTLTGNTDITVSIDADQCINVQGKPNGVPINVNVTNFADLDFGEIADLLEAILEALGGPLTVVLEGEPITVVIDGEPISVDFTALTDWLANNPLTVTVDGEVTVTGDVNVPGLLAILGDILAAINGIADDIDIDLSAVVDAINDAVNTIITSCLQTADKNLAELIQTKPAGAGATTAHNYVLSEQEATEFDFGANGDILKFNDPHPCIDKIRECLESPGAPVTVVITDQDGTVSTYIVTDNDTAQSFVATGDNAGGKVRGMTITHAAEPGSLVSFLPVAFAEGCLPPTTVLACVRRPVDTFEITNGVSRDCDVNSGEVGAGDSWVFEWAPSSTATGGAFQFPSATEVTPGLWAITGTVVDIGNGTFGIEWPAPVTPTITGDDGVAELVGSYVLDGVHYPVTIGLCSGGDESWIIERHLEPINAWKTGGPGLATTYTDCETGEPLTDVTPCPPGDEGLGANAGDESVPAPDYDALICAKLDKLIVKPTNTVKTVRRDLSGVVSSAGVAIGASALSYNLVAPAQIKVTLPSPHPDGANYAVQLTAVEGGAPPKGAIVRELAGSKTATGFEFTVVEGDDGANADDPDADFVAVNVTVKRFVVDTIVAP